MVTLPLRSVIALVLDKQHLGAGSEADDVVTVVDDLVGLHATVALSPFLQLRARIPAFTFEQLDVVLDRGRAAKVACMRRTLFIESAALTPVVLEATRALRLRDRDRFLAANGLTPRRYERLADRVMAALAGRVLDGRQLRDAVGADESLSPVIIVMCDEGRLVRWSGAAGWQSARPRYRRFDEALPSVRIQVWEESAAVRELIDRYIRRYGPVSERDIAWWTGLGKAAVRDAVSALPHLVRAGVEGLDGVHLLHEADVAAAQRAGATTGGTLALLPVLDPYVQGYRDRDRVIDASRRRFVIDRGGNATSVILLDGRVAGVWDLVAGRPPELRLCFFDAVGASARRRVRALAADITEFVAGESARISEVDRMAPLTGRSAGRFQSPLSTSG